MAWPYIAVWCVPNVPTVMSLDRLQLGAYLDALIVKSVGSRLNSLAWPYIAVWWVPGRANCHVTRQTAAQRIP